MFSYKFFLLFPFRYFPFRVFIYPSFSMSFIFHLPSVCLPFSFSCNFHTLLCGQSFSFTVIFYPCIFVFHFLVLHFSTADFCPSFSILAFYFLAFSASPTNGARKRRFYGSAMRS